MQKIIRLSLAVVMAIGLLSTFAAASAEETLSGKLACAKCTLKKAGVTECQDILTVTDAKGAKTEYWIAKDSAGAKGTHQCSSEADATVTGTVTEKDGKKWIAASKLVKK